MTIHGSTPHQGPVWSYLAWVRATLTGAGIALLVVSGAQSAEHPTLVNAESAVCLNCHEELIEGRRIVHVPVEDDCSACHEVTVEDGSTSVSLTDAEPALCLMCHGDLETAVAGELDTPHFPVTDSCLSCHDPHGAEQAHLLVAAVPEVCTPCHDPTDLEKPHGSQLTESTDCATCHRPHGSDQAAMLAGAHQHAPFADGSCTGCHRKPFGDRVRLRVRGERLCEACHGAMDELPQAGGSVHAALKGERGEIGCLSCHNPHMSPRPRLLVHEGPEVCETCHEPIVVAARDETGHFPAAEDCGNCHLPHTASHPSLLDLPTGELCTGCHDPSDGELAATHLGADLERLECVSCHTPHGSGNSALLAEHVHPPVLDDCETCHEGSYTQLMEGGGAELCLVCHEDVGEQAQQAAVPHLALEIGSCADCHNPHASAQPKLVAGQGREVCGQCHDEQLPGADETAHGVIDLLGCQACHEPHGGQRERMLRADAVDLCLGCHAADRVPIEDDSPSVTVLDRFEIPATIAGTMASLKLAPGGQHGHPLQGHRTLGTPTEEELSSRNIETDFSGELTCLTCHNPHKGRSAAILRWNAGTSAEACSQCHKTK